MRLLFLFLVMVNGLVYLWYSFHQQPVNASPAAMEGGYPQLVLLSELPQGSPVERKTDVPALSEESPESAETHTTSVVAKSCYTLGPFMNDDDLSRAARSLIQSGRPIEKRASEKRELIGYWVFFPAFDSREEALRKAEELKLLGEKQLYVVRKPEEYKNTISLGVFKSRKNAEKRFRQMKNLGYDIKLEGRYRQNPVHWIDYSEQHDSELLDLGSFVGAKRLDRPCETVASSE